MFRSPTQGDIDTARARLELYPPAPGNPKQVLVLLSASRSGSSALYEALTRSGDVVALPGEIEPILKLTANAQGGDWSNAVTKFVNVRLLRHLVRSQLVLYDPEPTDDAMRRAWKQRIATQWPRWSTGLVPSDDVRGDPFQLIHDIGLDPGWYDGQLSATKPTNGAELVVLEEPPLVVPRGCAYPRRLDGKTVLIKTPQNVYRPGLAERIFPGAPVRYIHLVRSMQATVNGLRDGWRHPRAFVSYHLPNLNIGDYRGGNWWCFDVPPGWQRLADAPLLDVCLFQWLEAHRAALTFGAKMVHWETILLNPAVALDLMCRELGILTPIERELKLVMTTAKQGGLGRWREHAAEYGPLTAQPEVRAMIERLGYTRDGDLR